MTAWPEVPLGEVLTQYVDYTDAPEPRPYPKLSVRLYGKGVTLDTPTDGTSLRMKRHQLAKTGQVILSEIWGKKGAIGIVPPEGDGALCTSHFFLFDIKHEKLVLGYLQAIFTANYLESQLGAEAKGTTGYAAVRPKTLLAATIPLPPLPEQRRIVARIDKLAAGVAEAKNLRTMASLETSSVAAATIRELLDGVGGTPGRLADATLDAANGFSRRPSSLEDGPVVLRLADVASGEVSLTSPRRSLMSQTERTKYALQVGDLLFVRVNGSKDIVGRCVPVRHMAEEFCYNDHLIRVRLDSSRLDWRYACLVANGPAAREHIEAAAITTAGQFTVNQGMLAGIPVPLVSLEKQHQTVAEVDALQTKVDELKRLQAETQAELDALMPSILDRAFKGEL